MRVSVYMPTKNRLDSLQRAVNSVLAQEHQDVELIVVDDASTDGSWAYLTALAQTEPRVRVIRHERSKGACAARNAAIRVSTGDFITGLDDDDEFTSTHISSLVAYWMLLTSGQSKVPACIFTQCLNRRGDQYFESRKQSCVKHQDLIDVNHIGNQIFAPRSHFFEAGLFDESMPAWQDLEFFYRVLKKCGEARLLDKASYVFDVTPRPDRISSGQKKRIVDAANRMIATHAAGDGRFAQRLMLQVYGDYYGFTVDWQDVWRFVRMGRWRAGYFRILSLYLFRRRPS